MLFQKFCFVNLCCFDRTIIVLSSKYSFKCFKISSKQKFFFFFFLSSEWPFSSNIFPVFSVIKKKTTKSISGIQTKKSYIWWSFDVAKLLLLFLIGDVPNYVQCFSTVSVFYCFSSKQKKKKICFFFFFP